MSSDFHAWSKQIATRQVELAVRQVNTAFAVLTEQQKVVAVRQYLEYVQTWLTKLESPK